MTSLRPLAKPFLSLKGRTPTGAPPRLVLLPLDSLRVDDAYQRTIERKGMSTIVGISNDFHWSRFAPLMVAPVPGSNLYSIIDGQHRATAAMVLGIDRVPCAIVEASPTEQASIFAAVNGNVTPVTILQLFKAARAAKAEWAMAIDEVCGKAGLVPLVYPKPKSTIRPFETMAIGTLRKTIIRFGNADVAAALKHATTQRGADEPGFWTSAAIDYAVAEWRTSNGKRQEPVAAGGVSMAQRIRDLKAKGYSRFAIQAALRVKLAEIEAALEGAA